MRNKFKKILSHSIAFVLGICVSIVITVYAATTYAANQVSYTNNGQSTVAGALDNLYDKALGWDTIYFSKATQKFTYKEPTGTAATYIKIEKNSAGYFSPYLCIYSSSSNKRACVDNVNAFSASTALGLVGGEPMGSSGSQYGVSGGTSLDGKTVNWTQGNYYVTTGKYNNKNTRTSNTIDGCFVGASPVDSPSDSSGYAYMQIRFGCPSE